MVLADPKGGSVFHVVPEWLALVVCVGIVAWRNNLLLGLVAAVALTAGLRAL